MIGMNPGEDTVALLGDADAIKMVVWDCIPTPS
jgi:hypothetical protein